MKTGKFIAVVTLLATLLSIGCGTGPEPFKYENDRDLRKGPGLFSGETGEFEIYTRQGEKKEPATADDPAAQETEPDPAQE